MANDIVLPFETVSNESELNQDLAAMAGLRQAAGDYAINIGSNFTLGTDLLAVNFDTSGGSPTTLTLQGNGHTIDGANKFRGPLVYSGNVTINHLSLDHMLARGGAGGDAANPGGGGAGLGAGLLVAAGGNVVLNNVSFAGERAIGGAGGNYNDAGVSGGGGGGLGGNGGSGFVTESGSFFDGGGGGVGLAATGGTHRGPGGAGIVPGRGIFILSGGRGYDGGAGGASGGGGGSSHLRGAGGGGVNGRNGHDAGNPEFGIPAGQFDGGNGGFGGGGGGGGSGALFGSDGGGSGGFGGGAGGHASTNTGGFGGGGGGGGDNRGRPGFGAGSGGGSDYGGGGGGAAFGADVLVQQGGTLTIGSGTLGAGTVIGGSGGSGRTAGNRGNPGGAAGDGIFLQGNQTVTFAPASGGALIVSGVIADQNAFRNPFTPGAGRVVVNGLGTTKLTATNIYTGGTSLQSGTLELAQAGAAGTGAITFGGSGPSEVLELGYVGAGAPTVSQAIRSLGVGASIYLPGVSAANGVFGGYSNNQLTFKSGPVSYTFSNLGVAAGATIGAASFVADKSGSGVDIVGISNSLTPGPRATGLSSNATGSIAAGTGSTQTIAQGSGQTTDAGAGGDRVILSRGAAMLVFHGGNDLAFLGGAAGPVDATVDDQASGLAVDVMNGGSDVFEGFGKDPSAVVDLLGGVGGYTKVADVVSALTSDGAGGSLLSLGVGQSIHFLGIATSALHDSNFQIG